MTPSAALSGIRVLVVDDDPDALTMMTLLLETHGASAHAAGSVAEALTAIASGPPDVLVSDLAMPGRDGYALIRAVRALALTDGGAMPAIAVSGFGNASERALAEGFERYVLKPFRIATLVETVAALAA